MTTKAPSSVKPAPDQILEKTAYACVAGIPTSEPHGQDRLGYSLCLWLKHRRDPLEVVIKTSGVRFLVEEEEVVRRIKDALKEHGISA
jgi:hypothetical protein